MKKRIFMILAMVWMGIIFYMSNQPASISAQHSGGVVELLSNLPYIGSIVTYLMDIDIAEFLVRKSAHMLSYFILAALLFMYMYEVGKSIGKVVLIVIVLTFLYACTDEFHQLFIPGRSGEFRDVMIDTIGGIIGCSVMYICSLIKDKFRCKID